MTKEFIPYQQGLQLKELGFDEPCWAWWHIADCDTRFCYSDQRSPIINSQETEIVGLPTYSQVFRWFRENCLLFGILKVDQTMEPKFCYSISRYEPTQFFEGWYDEVYNSDLYYSYEEAEQACLEKLIKIVNDDRRNS